jgi:excisionase family DNA binding protein
MNNNGLVRSRTRSRCRTPENADLTEAIEELRREALTIGEVCKACGLGRTTVYEAITAGRLKARKAGKRTLVLRDDMKAFLAALPEARPEL